MSETQLPDADDVPDRVSKFTTDLPEEYEGDNDEFEFAFVCPRCEKKNVLVGDPLEFRNKPFRCLGCNYVPLLGAEELEGFADRMEDSE